LPSLSRREELSINPLGAIKAINEFWSIGNLFSLPIKKRNLGLSHEGCAVDKSAISSQPYLWLEYLQGISPPEPPLLVITAVNRLSNAAAHRDCFPFLE